MVNPTVRKDMKGSQKLYCCPIEGCPRGPNRPFSQFSLVKQVSLFFPQYPVTFLWHQQNRLMWCQCCGIAGNVLFSTNYLIKIDLTGAKFHWIYLLVLSNTEYVYRIYETSAYWNPFTLLASNLFSIWWNGFKFYCHSTISGWLKASSLKMMHGVEEMYLKPNRRFKTCTVHNYKNIQFKKSGLCFFPPTISDNICSLTAGPSRSAKHWGKCPNFPFFS